jgi:hypothetical protein
VDNVDNPREDLEAYRDVLERVTVLEVSGRPDFKALVDLAGEYLEA